jgi:hypothetical protein
MSIWSTQDHFRVFEVDHQPNDLTVTIDVATTWHECVRLSIDSDDGLERGQCMLNPAQVARLIEKLQRASTAVAHLAEPGAYGRDN